MIKNYRELLAFVKSYELVKRIYEYTKSFPRNEMYGLVSQLRRAAVSIPSNISEGYMKGSKEYVHFLKIALGSSAEIDTMLMLSRDLKYLGEESFRSTYNLNLEVTKLLVTYIKKIKPRT